MNNFCFWWFLCGIIFDKVNGYVSLYSFEVCSVSFDADPSMSSVFEDDYVINYTPDDFPNYASGDSDVYFEYIRDSKTYELVANDVSFGGEIIDIVLKLDGEQNQWYFFQYLYENSGDNCDCDTDLNNLPIRADNLQTITWSQSPNNQALDSNQNVEVRICSTWENFVDDDDTAEQAVIGSWDEDTMTADRWDCENWLCEDLSTVATVGTYRGFEVFTYSYECPTPGRRNADGNWRCFQCNNAEGFFRFGYNSARSRCLNCRWLFGESCEYCDRYIGCAQCSGPTGPEGEAIDRWPISGDCEWQYCGGQCCESEDEDAAPPTMQPTESCNDTAPIGGGQGSTDYDCRTHDERIDAAPDGPYDDHYRLPDPGNVADCDNHVPLECQNTDFDPNCVECNPAGNLGNLRGCKHCSCADGAPDCDADDDEYFWYSNALPCVSCEDAFYGNCESCKNGGDFGGGGCDDPAPGYTLRYDTEFLLWYPEPTNSLLPTSPVAPSPDGWEGLECLTKCSERRGINDFCYCGTDCINDPIKADPYPDGLPNATAPFYCIDCHFQAGCDQCYNNNQDSTQDYFMLSKEHPCVNCAETFGTRCLFCNDFIGCAQCDTGYVLTFSECCQMWYCYEEGTQF